MPVATARTAAKHEAEDRASSGAHGRSPAAGEPLPVARRRLLTSRRDGCRRGTSRSVPRRRARRRRRRGRSTAGSGRPAPGPASPVAGEPGIDRRRPAGARGVDREVVVELARGSVDRDLREPAGRRDPVHPAVGSQVRQQAARGRSLASSLMPFVAVRGRQQGRRAIGEQVDVGLDRLGCRSCRGPGSGAGPTGSSSGS